MSRLSPAGRLELKPALMGVLAGWLDGTGVDVFLSVPGYTVPGGCSGGLAGQVWSWPVVHRGSLAAGWRA